MDRHNKDIEFFDFESASEEEIKEIQSILKGPRSNGCVELPWDSSFQDSSSSEDTFQSAQSEDLTENAEQIVEPAEITKSIPSENEACFSQPTALVTQQVAPLLPQNVAPIPTTLSPYSNNAYIVSRTLPYVPSYPAMGVPIFACPVPPSDPHYGQFVPFVPAAFNQGPYPNNNHKSHARHRHNNNRKKNSNSSDSGQSGKQTPDIASPSSVNVVPLPSTFAMAPMHGYPPGIPTLPYGGTQTPSTAMYYVPVFNHPYGSYMAPPAANHPMVLPVNMPTSQPSAIPPETNFSKPDRPCTDKLPSTAKRQTDLSGERLTDESSVAKASSELEEDELTDCNSISDSGKSGEGSSLSETAPNVEKTAVNGTDEDSASKCWADLFRKPLVNGIDSSLQPKLKEKDIVNGKVPIVPH